VIDGIEELLKRSNWNMKMVILWDVTQFAFRARALFCLEDGGSKLLRYWGHGVTSHKTGTLVRTLEQWGILYKHLVENNYSN
jgi:hypothetical protein